MENYRSTSNPELIPLHNPNLGPHADHPHILEGVAAEVKLLLKLINEHNACARETDGRRPQRLATMLTILDDIRSRVHKAQSSIPNRRAAELRRCNTELHRNSNKNNLINTSVQDKEKEKEKKPPLGPAGAEDHHQLRRQLSANMTARKGLEKMFYSLSKEKELIAGELSRKVQDLSCMEELANDLRAQNEMLYEKVKNACSGSPSGDDEALSERNKELSEQLLKSLEGYRYAKRRLKGAMEESERVNGRIAETAMDAAAGIERVRKLREKIRGSDGIDEETDEELKIIERAFAGFYRKLLMTAATTTPATRESPRDSPMRKGQIA